MSVPKLPPFDSQAANLAWRGLKKSDGTPYSVFAGSSFPNFVTGLRGQRDIMASHAVQLADHKGDIDEHAARLNDLEHRMAVQEARPASTFP
jgi:hypothetical protein